MHIWPMLITWKQAIIIIRPQSCLLKPTATENDNRSDGGASPCAAVFYVGECCCAVAGRTIGDLKVVVRGAGPHVPSVRGIMVSHETIRRWAEKFRADFANSIRRRTPHVADKWHLDEGAPPRRVGGWELVAGAESRLHAPALSQHASYCQSSRSNARQEASPSSLFR
jgi:hypothetical protein